MLDVESPVASPDQPDWERCSEIGLWCLRGVYYGWATLAGLADALVFNGRSNGRILPLLPRCFDHDLFCLDAYVQGYFHSETDPGQTEDLMVALNSATDCAGFKSAAFTGDPIALVQHRQVTQTVTQVKRKIQAWLESKNSTEEALLPTNQPGNLTRNLSALAETLSLSFAEARLIRFAVLSTIKSVLRKIQTRRKGTKYDCGEVDFSCMLSEVLDLPLEEVAAALAPTGVLMRASILSLEYDQDGDASLRLDAEILTALMTGTPETLFSAFFSLASETALGIADFDYCQDRVALLQRYLRQAIDRQQPGVNILLYGVPGAGKSELAKVLARWLAVPLYRVAEEKQDKSALDREGRLLAYCLSQTVLGKSPAALVLFDEVEDIFAAQTSEASSAQKAKGFVNRLLETNAVPTIWITNSTHSMDAAVLRRFDVVLQMSIPPKEVRRRIARGYFKALGEPPEYLFDVDLTAADFARIAKVASLVLDNPDAVALLSTEYLKLWGEQHKVRPVRNGAALPFDPTLCSCDHDLDALVQGLRRHSAAVLLVGPVGSGKAALARHLGEQLGRCVVTSAADLVGDTPFSTVGHIRHFLDQLQRENAVGVIENADIFVLATREQDAPAAQNVVVTDNLADMLARHPGTVLVCCGTPAPYLPVSWLNCFEIRLELKPLTSELVQRYCAVACRVPIERFQNGLARRTQGLSGLVPQAVTNVLHRAQILGREISPEWLLSELEQEAALVRSGGRKAGF